MLEFFSIYAYGDINKVREAIDALHAPDHRQVLLQSIVTDKVGNSPSVSAHFRYNVIYVTDFEELMRSYGFETGLALKGEHHIEFLDSELPRQMREHYQRAGCPKAHV